MTYKTVRITELMAHEFGQVEGAFDSLDKKAVQSAIPSNLNYNQFIEQLKQGHRVLLNDSPTLPMLKQVSSAMGVKTWELNSQALNNIDPAAQKALLARTQKMGGGGSGENQSGNLHPPLPMPPYVPEPIVSDSSEKTLTLNYEYCFDIACSSDSLRKNVGCFFKLSQTKEEQSLSHWSEVKTEQGIRCTVLAAVDEPKRLNVHIAAHSMGISLKPVKVRAIGSQVADEGFIPVTPAVQLGERLGFPTEGYYYHFHDGQLIQEYKLLGEEKRSFYATRSTHQRLDDTQGYNQHQTALLVFWKIAGQVVENQYLIYREKPITRDELDNLNEEWLSKHGVKLDIPALLDTIKQPVAQREETQPKVQDKPQPIRHTVQIDLATGQRETWIKIAEQYGLAPKELLLLNPHYKDKPMSLAVGDALNVKKSEPQKAESPAIYDIPPLSPQTFNHPLNSFYQYTGTCLVDTKVKAIKFSHFLTPDIPLVNLKTLSTASKATDYGQLAFLAVPQNGIKSHLGVISSNASSTIGKWTISGEALLSFARVGGGLITALWSSKLGDATLDGHPELSSEPTAKTRVRFNMYTDEHGKQQVVGIKTGDGSAYGERVAKREAKSNGQNLVAELDSGITITWTPDGSTDVLTPDTITPENNQLDVHNIWVRPIEEHHQEIGTVLYPETELAEYIVTFPADAGLPPLYLVFRKTARDESGVVTGSGEDITGIWLEKAGEGQGSPIPSQIADKLRGKEFSSFDNFRRAFWKEVSKDPILSRQFISSNMKRMKKGKAPRARFKDTVGGRRSFELHHLKEIQHSGKVYHVDNIRVNTPRNHIDIHKG